MTEHRNPEDERRGDASTDRSEELWDHALRRAFAGDDVRSAAPASVWIAPAPAERELPPITARGTSGETFPATIGRYRVLGEIACGGIGVVVEVRDEELGRNLAMKLLRRRHRVDAPLAQRFVEEAQIAAQLQHPGIVPIHEIGRIDGRPYFTMKLVRGETLTARIRQRGHGKDQLPALLRIFDSLCRTLAYAHARGVVHRDLKPANIMVDAFDEVQVMDWGLAKVGAASVEDPSPVADEPTIETLRTAGNGTESLAGQVMGTPAYMAPEQARGDLDAIDARSDVFALGAILCELLTGSPPYGGDRTSEVHRRASAGELESAWSRIDESSADPELRALARRCLSIERNDRPWDAGAVSEALAAYTDQLAERARQAEVDAELARETAAGERRVRRRTAALFAVVVVASIAVGWASVSASARDRRTVTQTFLHQRAEITEARRFSELSVGAPADAIAPFLESAERAVSWARELESLPARHVRGVTGSTGPALVSESTAVRDAIRVRLESGRRLDTLRVELSRLSGLFFFGSGEEDLEAQYRAAFAAVGIDLDALAEVDLVERIRSGPDPRSVIDGLEEWALVLRRRGRVEWGRVLGIARRAAIDAGATYPEGLVREDRAALREHARAALAEDLTWPANTILLAAAMLDPDEDAELIGALHRHGADRYAGDARFHLELARDALVGRPRDHELAVAHLRAVAALWPDRLRVRIMLGTALLGLDRFGEAREVFRAALDVHPESADAHNAYGYALQRSGDDARALLSLERAVEIEPDHRLALENMVAIHRHSDRRDEAVRVSEILAAAHPNDPVIHFRLGIARMVHGDHEGAGAAYRDAIARDPEYAEAHLNLANVLIERGRTGEGIEHLRTGHRIGSARPRWRHPSDRWVDMAEELRRLELVSEDPTPPPDHWSECRTFAFEHSWQFPAACARLLMRVESESPDLFVGADARWNYARALANAGRWPVPRAVDAPSARFRKRAIAVLEEAVTEIVAGRDGSISPADQARLGSFATSSWFATLRREWSLEAIGDAEFASRCRALRERIAALVGEGAG